MLDEIVKPTRQVGEHDDEAGGAFGEQTFLHFVRDRLGVPTMARPEYLGRYRVVFVGGKLCLVVDDAVETDAQQGSPGRRRTLTLRACDDLHG